MAENSKKKVSYVYDQRLLTECDRLPMVQKRASIVHDLINSYGLLNMMDIKRSSPATEEDLKLFHSSSFVEFLKNVNKSKDLESFYEEQDEYGFGYDCMLLDRIYNLVRIIAGGSLTAAKLLMDDKCDIVINWFGGWHHAGRDVAEGFCYVNDIAIAIQYMLRKFRKILYIDMDIHHGNGVQNAFELTKKVLTLSFHKWSPGFYPGTGNIEEIGFYDGKYYSMNVPLMEGIGDKTYVQLFSPIFTRVYKKYEPEVIVVQCGADGLFKDPLGESNLTLQGFGECVKQILQCQKPTMFLGGGGYNSTNAARLWTYLTSLILNITLPEDIPDCSKYFTKYVPSYELHISPGNQKDTNTEYYINSVINKISEFVTFIE